ncbi:multicopper oxidase domain-containing protein [Desertibaculum subflavum]|uniref:multicopper oxidase domain-containing protein n=1 Tax=Desertibaculum subflavum TaxID=2268458 RepID=UPI000E66B818
MTISLARRSFLVGSAAAFLPQRSPLAAPSFPLTLTTRTIEVKRRPVRALSLVDRSGHPGIQIPTPFEFRAEIHNTLPEPVALSWTGQDVGPAPAEAAEPIKSNAHGSVEFRARPGTHLVHAGDVRQAQELLSAPVVFLEPGREDRQDIVLLLQDFSFRPADEHLHELMERSAPGHRHGGGLADEFDIGDWPPRARGGRHPGEGSILDPHLHDIDHDAYLANHRTLDDPEVVRVERGGRLRLRVINGATSTAFWIDFGGRRGAVIATDGRAVVPVTDHRFPIAPGQRLDIALDLPRDGAMVPVFAQREGDRVRAGLVLAPSGAPIPRLTDMAEFQALPVDLSLDVRLRGIGPHGAPPSRSRVFALTGDDHVYDWGIDNAHPGEGDPVPLPVGTMVEAVLINDGIRMHPMSFEGLDAHVVALGSRRINGAVRDTVIVPGRGGRVAVLIEARAPGDRLLACHNLYHRAVGMVRHLRFATHG